MCSITFAEEILNGKFQFLYIVRSCFVFVKNNCAYPYFNTAVANAVDSNQFFGKVILLTGDSHYF